LINATEGSAIHSNSSFEVINRAGGLIEAREIAVFSQNGNATVVNAGMISSESNLAIKANFLILENSGTIQGGTHSYRGDITNHGVITGGYYSYAGLKLTNYGSSTGDIELDVAGVAGQGYSGYTFAIIDNRSNFEGDILITGEARSYLQPPPAGTIYQTEVTNSGTIDGSIVSNPTLGPSPTGAAMDFTFVELIVNNGNITGDVVLGAGDDRYSGTGTVAGSVDGGSGEDELHGGSQSDRLQGGSGDDILGGGSGDDTLSGGEGEDLLTGGSGNDTFNDTAAGVNGDTITDFAAGDRIVFSDASLDGFTFSLNGSTLTYTGGSLTPGGFTGQLQASAAAGGGGQLTVVGAEVNNVRNDFNGDGRSDILWRNDDGLVLNWLGQPNGGMAGNEANLFVDVSADFHIEGIGDFNGDGRDDILWRNDDGLVLNWLGQPNGGMVGNEANLFVDVSADWHIQSPTLM